MFNLFMSMLLLLLLVGTADLLALNESVVTLESKIAALHQTVNMAVEACFETNEIGEIGRLLPVPSYNVLVEAISDDQATVVVSPSLRQAVKLGADSDYTLKLTFAGGRWTISDSASLVQLADDWDAIEIEYREMYRDPQVLRQPGNSAAILGVHSDYLLNSVDWSSDPYIPRVNRNYSASNLNGQKLFGSPFGVSSFVHRDSPSMSKHVVAISDMGWRRIVVADDTPDHSFIESRGFVGTGNNLEEFSRPLGLEFWGSSFLYIAEDYNNRIKMVEILSVAEEHLELQKIIQIPEFNRPMDLDVTMPDQYGERTLVVANSGGNNIIVFDDREPLGPYHIKVHSSAIGVGAFEGPTSIAFGRDPLTSQKTFTAFFIDSDNRRVVRLNDAYTVPSQGAAFTDFPDPKTDLSSIAVDNKGEVYVVDRGLGKVYKFSWNLVPLAQHGYLGQLEREYLYPTSLSFTQGFDQPSGQMIAGLGETVIAERWTNDTGLRRLVPGTELSSTTIDFVPKLTGGTPSRIKGKYFISGFSNVTEDLISPSGAVLESRSQLMKATGLRSYDFSLNSAWPSGQYTMRVTAASIYTNSNTDQVTLTVNVDQSLTNERPVVNNIWFPSGDSCFIRGEITRIAGGATDPDGQVVEYIWSVYPPNTGNFLFAEGNEIEFYTDEEPGKDVGAYIQLKVRDNYGEESTPMYQLSFLPLIKYWPYDCICTWQPGDPDFNHIITISDIVYIINYIFSGGDQPKPVLEAGDADCNGVITISDSQYLINWMYAGGPAVQCDCSDY